MPRIKTSQPAPSRHKQEINIDYPSWFWRILPPYQNPSRFFEATRWRKIVESQPLAAICRDTLVDNYLSKDWKIEPRDSTQRDELKGEIKYYTKFLTKTGDYDYTEIVDWIGKDLLDVPFGGAAEIGRSGFDQKVYWIELLDAATLFPTKNSDHPVGQVVPGYSMNPVYFPNYTIDRIIYSPLTDIREKGWALTPPMKVYLALESLNRGDLYYANLLLDTPQAGILDLGDMAKKSAEEWVKSFRELLGGIDPMKIPVLYEHNNEIRFIPFSQPPTALIFDKMMLKYASILTAGYGMGLSDIGLQAAAGGGETLAGSIRQERKSRNTGFARIKKKIKAFFDFILPEDLEYRIIDQDDELAVAMGRARLANATAAAQFIELNIFTPEEMRLQTIADGLVSISVPEKIPEDAIQEQTPTNGTKERPGLLGKPIAPSQGGYGEVLPRGDLFSLEMDRIASIPDFRLRRLIRGAIKPLLIDARSVLDDEIDDIVLGEYASWYGKMLWGDVTEDIPELTIDTVGQAMSSLEKLMSKGEKWWKIAISDSDIYNDFSDILKGAIQSKSQEKAELAYERGEIDEIKLPEINFDKYGKALKAKIFDIITEINKSIPTGIRLCVISGVGKSLITNKLAKSFDENELVTHDRVIEYVRDELIEYANTVVSLFTEQISEAIKELIEE